MNILFSTQTASLDIFYNLMQEIKKYVTLDNIGFYVAGSRYFNTFTKDNPSFESASFSFKGMGDYKGFKKYST